MMSSVTTKTAPQQQTALVGVILLLMRDGKVFLQKRESADGWLNRYAPVAGKVDDFELPSQAMIREAAEEIGITIQPENLRMACMVQWNALPDKHGQLKNYIEYYYQCDVFDGEPVIMEPEKASDIGFYALDQLPDKTVGSVNLVLDAIERGQYFLEWSGQDRF